MSDRINILRRVSSLDRSPEFDGVTKLICNIDDETQISVGTDTGYALEFTNPLMTREVLEGMLEKIRGYQYQPYQARGALLDPAAEMGDGVSVGGLYGGIYTRSRNFSRLMAADITAPHDEEIDHEYHFETKQERKVKREMSGVRASLLVQAERIQLEVDRVWDEDNPESIKSILNVQADEISARVTATGGTHASFGWSLSSDGFTLWSGNTEVMKCTSDGLVIKGNADITGKVTATSGKIGGFDIKSKYISYNNMTWGGTQNTGIYIGTSGIQLGSKFKIDASGNLTASSGTFTGSVRASSIQYGGNNGTLHADALTNSSISSSKYGSSSIGNGALSNGSVSYGKTSFTSTLDQVGINKSDISALSSRVATISAGYFNTISTSSILLGNYSLYVYNGQVYASYVG